MARLEGSWVALVTPFQDGRIDGKALDRLLDFHLEARTDGLVICGTTGESATLSADERAGLMETVARRVGGKTGLMFGTGGNHTAGAVEMTRRAKDLGAEAVLVVTPYYNKPTQAGLQAHFQAVAAATPLPVVLYNVPGRTGVNLAAATTLELAKTANIKAVKEASGNLDQIMDILAKAPAGFSLLSGDDALNFAILALGGRGTISVTGNVAPRQLKACNDAALAGDWNKAREIHFGLLDLHRALFLESNPIPVKTALHLMGFLRDEFRLPLVPMGAGPRAQLKQVLDRMGLTTR
ncbi:MAG: 4-hydroxy-tetrahydrodipicolinate synthase [Candidatus Riflebacteria bacterium]|nr:4-hydroxy-tetrahydrodipicolinate synthase [Candidatus Riflebacteria bacterium]